VKQTLRRAGRILRLSIELYRELTLSALTLLPSRR
jgi:hypothetical protein